MKHHKLEEVAMVAMPLIQDWFLGYTKSLGVLHGGPPVTSYTLEVQDDQDYSPQFGMIKIPEPKTIAFGANLFF